MYSVYLYPSLRHLHIHKSKYASLKYVTLMAFTLHKHSRAISLQNKQESCAIAKMTARYISIS